ncbi:hypothetical protein B0T26DRAFT_376682 [Lasiosphaeria miniovina]|uniref:Uncharacterized protein n=1 Tax=Lasiosphaeria miniovina TaxID=1954250 RepID=A0AA40DRU8_9PEZI|nr:uncharacterized protein B0T26DRAFT_376682 [Lasiosphaeria miniovina]KAK0713854.1 hypothetical protein B0T26DRAFT_376682 [Lasiosphaeria miniovina]
MKGSSKKDEREAASSFEGQVRLPTPASSTYSSTDIFYGRLQPATPQPVLFDTQCTMSAPPPLLEARRRPKKLDLELSPRQQILFLHPGYDSLNTLLILPCVDPVTSNTVIVDYGVYHNTALLACQIIAGNAFKGTYLALDEAGKKRVQVPREGTLTDPEYYFIVPGEGILKLLPHNDLILY